jgi:hypothetical protein
MVRLACFTTGISTLAHLLPHVTLRRFLLRPAQAGLNFGSGPAHSAHPADRTVAELRPIPLQIGSPIGKKGKIITVLGKEKVIEKPVGITVAWRIWDF